MSKVGRKPIDIPQEVSVDIARESIHVKGPQGALMRVLPRTVKVVYEDNVLTVTSPNPALWGTWRAHIANMVKGVTEGFMKTLEIKGVGYKVTLKDSTFSFALGFSHPVTVAIPKGLSCEVKENSITIRGVDKEAVGQFAAFLRSLRPPDAYKGKGIRYEGEVVPLKPGKKAGVASQTA